MVPLFRKLQPQPQRRETPQGADDLMPLIIENWPEFAFYVIALALSLFFASESPVRLALRLRRGRPLKGFFVRFTRINAAFVALWCCFALLQFAVFHLRK
jgi:hypothetical protein